MSHDASGDAAALCLPMLLKTPPGQLKNVLHDVKRIVGASPGAVSEEALLAQAQPFLEQHSHDQLAVAPVEHNGEKDDAIVCEAAKLSTPKGVRYVHPRLQCTFQYDHAQELASDVQPFSDTHELEAVRAALDEKLGKYVYNHFHTGVSSVFRPTALAIADNLPEPGVETVGVENEDVETETKDEVMKEASEAKDEENAKETLAEAQETADADNTMDTDAPSEPKTEPAEAEAAPAEAAPAEAAPTEAVPAEAAPTEATPTEATPAEATPAKAAATSTAEATPAAHTESAPAALTVHIVGNKYNLRNFWSGRWRSTYTIDPKSFAIVQAAIYVDSHYFENGNVQLHAENHDVPSVDTPGTEPASVAEALVAVIEKHEQAYQSTLFTATDSLREQAFKALRRTLPITRQKIDWDKAVSYKLGAELAQQ